MRAGGRGEGEGEGEEEARRLKQKQKHFSVYLSLTNFHNRTILFAFLSTFTRFATIRLDNGDTSELLLWPFFFGRHGWFSSLLVLSTSLFKNKYLVLPVLLANICNRDQYSYIQPTKMELDL